ncbi:MAG: hypothetical protein AAF636_11545 [Pseudomonadota bacterium]
MPIYEYLNLNTDKIEEHFKAYKDRDDVPKHLNRVPSAPGIVVAKKPLPTDGENTIKALSEYENTVGVKEIERQTGFSATELKKTWTDPYNNEPVTDDE